MAFGDRKDGKLVKDIDGMHFICPIIYPKRCDNEAFISERIDLTNVDKYLKKKNKNNPEDKYNLFQIIVTASLKMLYLRPKMNYFIANSNLYCRNEKTLHDTAKLPSFAVDLCKKRVIISTKGYDEERSASGAQRGFQMLREICTNETAPHRFRAVRQNLSVSRNGMRPLQRQ